MNDPTIDITLNPYVGRVRTQIVPINIMSSDRILYKGEMVDGRIRGKIDSDVAALSDWNAPLMIKFVKYKALER